MILWGNWVVIPEVIRMTLIFQRSIIWMAGWKMPSSTYSMFSVHIGPIFLQILSWIEIIFDLMILLMIFIFQDHWKGNLWNSQQPNIVYEVSWLNFDKSLSCTFFALLSLKKKQIYRINTLWAWTRSKKPKILNQDRNRNIGNVFLKILYKKHRF